MHRPTAKNQFAHPWKGWVGRLITALGNCRAIRRLRRSLYSRLPFVALASDVQDVVYLNWVVPASAVRSLVPAGIGLVERDGFTLFTVLTYRHGHFGPAFLGPLRRLFPSPLQSNWRLYVEIEGVEDSRGVVLFVRNVFDNLLYVLGSRLGSDALPSHLPSHFIHRRDGDAYRSEIEAGGGSAPQLSSAMVRTQARTLPPEFQRFFRDWEEAVLFLSQQDAAVVAVEDEDRVAHAGISLPIDIDAVEPLRSQAIRYGDFLEMVGANGNPFCFAIPEIRFKVLWERLLPAARSPSCKSSSPARTARRR